MTIHATPIPAGIGSPSTRETRLGTLHSHDGVPDEMTVATLFGNRGFR